jgi:hypothetical protein
VRLTVSTAEAVALAECDRLVEAERVPEFALLPEALTEGDAEEDWLRVGAEEPVWTLDVVKL